MVTNVPPPPINAKVPTAPVPPKAIPLNPLPETEGKQPPAPLSVLRLPPLIIDDLSHTENPNTNVKHCFVTVMRHLQPVGKTYGTDALEAGASEASPKIRKHTVFNTGDSWATTHYVPTVESFAAVIRAVQNDPCAALLLSYVKSIVPKPLEKGGQLLVGAVSEEYRIAPQTRLMAELGLTEAIQLKTPKKMQGIKWACRNKLMQTRSAWCMFDSDEGRDTPQHILDRLANESYIDLLADIIPALKGVDHVSVGSASSRVLLDGVPVSKSNKHLYVLTQHANDQKRFCSAAMIAAGTADLGYFAPPRDPRTHELIETHYGQLGQWTTIFDPAVFSIARVSYEGKPSIDLNDTNAKPRNGKPPRLEIVGSEVEIIHGTVRTLNTLALITPVMSVQRNLGVEFSGSGENFAAVNRTELTPDVMINVKDENFTESWITFQEFIDGDAPKLRANNPFKAGSASWSAYLQKEDMDGNATEPFLFSVEFGKYLYNNVEEMFTIDEPVTPAPPALKQSNVPVPPAPTSNIPAPPAPTSNVPVPPASPVPPSTPVPPVPNQSVAVTKHAFRTLNSETRPFLIPLKFSICDMPIDPKIDLPVIMTKLCEAVDQRVGRQNHTIEENTVTMDAINLPNDVQQKEQSTFFIDAKFGKDDNNVINATAIGKKLYVWNGEVWMYRPIENWIGLVAKSMATINNMSELNSLTSMIIASCVRDEPIEPLPRHYLPCANGLLNCQTMKLEPFNRKYMYTSTNETVYDPTELGNGVLLKILADSSEGDSNFVRRALQLFGYATMAGVNNLQNIVVFHGASRSGKSVMASMVEKLAHRTVAAKTAKVIQDKTVATMVNKNLWVDDDMQSTFGRETSDITSAIKAFTSNAKHDLTQMYTQDTVEARVNIKMLWCCNELPNLEDAAMLTRMEVLTFPKSFHNVQDSSLDAAIDVPEYRTARALNLAIAGYLDLLAFNGYDSAEAYLNSTGDRGLKFVKISWFRCVHEENKR